MPAPPLLQQAKFLVDAARQRLAVSVNARLTKLPGQVGACINADLLQNARAEYGKQTVRTLAREPNAECGSSSAEKSRRRMVRFAEVFPKKQLSLYCHDH